MAGLAGTVSDIDVTLHGLDCSDQNPDFAYMEDLDMLLVGPTGTNLVVLSDIGGDNQPPALQFADITVTLDDEAPSPPPADTQLSGGTYRPHDDDDDLDEQVSVDTFPAPAPSPSATTALSVFDGTDPNGTWSLYVVKDYQGPNVCSVLRGWSLKVSTTGDTPPTTAVCNSPPPAGAIVGSGGGDMIQPGFNSTGGPAPTGGDDVIFGLGGGDQIDGGGGDDLLCGGPGGDQLIGGPGHDMLVGGGGSDALSGQGGNDALAGGPATDSCAGGSGSADTADSSCAFTTEVP